MRIGTNTAYSGFIKSRTDSNFPPAETAPCQDRCDQQTRDNAQHGSKPWKKYLRTSESPPAIPMRKPLPVDIRELGPDMDPVIAGPPIDTLKEWSRT